MLLFVGQFQHSLDAKGRLILPAKFRPEFEHGGHLAPNPDGCVALWTPAEFARKSAEYLEAARRGSPKERHEARFWATHSADAEFDRQGRFAVPPTIRDYAALDGEVIIAGNLDHLELWNPASYLDQVESVEEAFKRGEGQ